MTQIHRMLQRLARQQQRQVIGAVALGTVGDGLRRQALFGVEAQWVGQRKDSAYGPSNVLRLRSADPGATGYSLWTAAGKANEIQGRGP